jgi:Flp pilus assembly pilin Flp
MLIKRRAQSTLEYSLIVAVVVGALIAMQVYVKRGVQGRLKSATDDIGEQYSPGYTTGNIVINTTSSTKESLQNGVTSTLSNTVQNKTTNEDTEDLSNEYWGE